MTGLYLHSGKNMLLSALLLMLFQCAFAANYADAEKQVRMWIGTKHIDNRKMLEICIKKVDDISSLQLPEMQKIEELKKSFAPAFSELKKAQSEVKTELFRQAYLKHEYKAQGIIGCCFYFGIGVERDYSQAVKWLEKAAAGGEKEAQFILGICCYYGQGTKLDIKRAAELFRNASDRGHHGAELLMGLFYHEGIELPKEYFQAFEYFDNAAKSGCMVAECILGNCYFFGDGVDQNYTNAVKWYTSASEHGDTEATWRLGYCYHNGFGCQKDDTKALELYQKSAESDDRVGVNLMTGRYYFRYGAILNRDKVFQHVLSDEKKALSAKLEKLSKTEL